MEVMHKWEKAEYVLIKNVCSEEELKLCRNELEIVLPILEPPKYTGSATEDGNLIKENMGIFFDKIYTPLFGDCSPCTKIIDKTLKIVSTGNFTPHSIMNYMKVGGYGYNVLFSAYRNKDYYEAHRDCATLTLLFWLKNKDFSGGNLIFSDFNEKIPFEDNTILVFPSHYMHEVDEVTSPHDGYVRYVVTAFLNLCGQQK